MNNFFSFSVSSNTKKFYLLVFAEIILNGFQAFFSSITEDEMYYATTYSQTLSWGYFDHPPMLALFIKTGVLLFGNTILGVRFVGILALGVSKLFLWNLFKTEKNNHPYIFFLITTLPFLYNAFGFIVGPDAPLLFFSTLYLICFNSFLNKQNTLKSILLGILMTAMLYSKYHSALTISISFLSFPSLLKKRVTYLAFLVGFVCYIPHIYWQVSHHFPSLQYHLIQRNKTYQLEFTLMYLLNQLAIYGFTLPVLILGFKKSLFKNRFEKILLNIIIGFLVFFFFASFKGWVEPHWTSSICIPSIILIYTYYLNKSFQFKKWILRLGVFTLVVLFFMRAFFMFNFKEMPNIFNQQKTRMQHLPKYINSSKLIFYNSYQIASEIAFFTKIKTKSLSDNWGRKSQYDLMNNSEWNGDTVTIMAGHFFNPLCTLMTPEKNFNLFYLKVYPYYFYGNIQAKIDTLSFYKKENALFFNANITDPDTLFEKSNSNIVFTLYYLDSTLQKTQHFNPLVYSIKEKKSTSNYTLTFSVDLEELNKIKKNKIYGWGISPSQNGLTPYRCSNIILVNSLFTHL